jgi:hypothetical protein
MLRRNLQNVYVLIKSNSTEMPAYQVNQMGGNMQRRISPKSSTIYVNLRAEDTLFLFRYTRSFEVLVVYLIPKMQRCGAGCQQALAHIDTFCAFSAVLPMARSRILDVPAILESRIRLVRRTSVCSYG